MNTYDLSRSLFDYSYENPDKVKPGHIAVYFFALDTWNRMGWKEKFGFSTDHAMEAIGIRKYQTYIAYLNELVEWGFITMVQRSTNQYTANIISINTAMPKNGKALDKANACYAKKRQSTGQSNGKSTGQSKDSIDKQRTKNKEIDDAAKPPPFISDLEKRESDFYESLKVHLNTYPKEMIRTFFDYWREPNKSKTRMRWEQEKTWDLNLRLQRWANNERPQSQQQQKQQQHATDYIPADTFRKAQQRTAELFSDGR